MISDSKIESADFCLSSRGYRILFKNEFLLFQFALNQKYRAANFFRPIAAKLAGKYAPALQTLHSRLEGALELILK